MLLTYLCIGLLTLTTHYTYLLLISFKIQVLTMIQDSQSPQLLEEPHFSTYIPSRIRVPRYILLEAYYRVLSRRREISTNLQILDEDCIDPITFLIKDTYFHPEVHSVCILLQKFSDSQKPLGLLYALHRIIIRELRVFVRRYSECPQVY